MASDAELSLAGGSDCSDADSADWDCWPDRVSSYALVKICS